MAPTSAYDPYKPAKRPSGKPDSEPRYRVLVHKRFLLHYNELSARVGEQQAKQFWDHVANTPGRTDPVASTSILKGRAGRAQGPGWSRTIHYEVSSSARIDYQYNDDYVTAPGGDPHPVVAILTINYGSHLQVYTACNG
jgi:hypothetical protein